MKTYEVTMRTGRWNDLARRIGFTDVDVSDDPYSLPEAIGRVTRTGVIEGCRAMTVELAEPSDLSRCPAGGILAVRDVEVPA